MRNALLALLIGLLPVARLEAQDKFIGISCLACQAYTERECDKLLPVFDGVNFPAISILWGSFTLHNLCAQKFLDKVSDRPHLIQIHISNEVGRRNKRLAPYEFLSWLSINEYNSKLLRNDRATIRAIRTRLSRIMGFINQYANENTQFNLTTGLEDNFTNAAFGRIARDIKEQWHGVVLVRNPVGNNYSTYFHGAHLIELHGWASNETRNVHGLCSWSNDGDDFDFGDGRGLRGALPISAMFDQIRHIRNSCRQIFLWWSGPQGIADRFIEPRNRSFQIHGSHVRAVNDLLRRLEK